MAETFDIPIGNVVGPQGPQGEPGQSGEDGFSPEVSVSTITGGHRVTITDAEGDHAFDVMDGHDAEAATAEDVSYDDTETYSNGTVGKELTELNQHLTLKEDKLTIVTKAVSDTEVTLEADKFYIFPEMLELEITCPLTGLYGFRFTSGTTPTTFAMDDITMPDDWEGAEASTTYEMSILNGMCLVAKWEVSGA